MAKRLSKTEIRSRLKKLEGWKLAGKSIKKKLVFKNFISLIRFVNKIAPVAEKEEHHPDLRIHYKTLVISITTHDAGGLTDWDFDLARKIDRLLK